MSDTQSFKKSSIVVTGIVVLLALVLFTLWPAAQIFLVIFAAILFAILVDGLAMLITQWLRMPQGIARGTVMLLLLAALIAFLMLAGPRFSDQVSELADRLPLAVDRLNKMITAQPWGQLLKNIELIERLKPSAPEILADVTVVFSTTFKAIANIFVIGFIGFYLALQPEIYVRGFLHLIPKQIRGRAAEVLDALGHALRWWLVGRFTSMAIVGVLTTLALGLIDMPLALVLGVIAGLFTFVPFIGPISSVIPAMLIGLMESPLMAFYALIIYSVVQFIEGNFLTPLIQKRIIAMPPALLLAAQFFMGVFYGLFGLLLATPLAVTGTVLVQMLYVQDFLKDSVRVLGQHGHRPE
ncbi:MAG: AI-2E family transporter [Gammaproteobacteria bacterium]|jgi:predicted PurR-regulated permease PerM